MKDDLVSGARVAIGAATNTPRRLTEVETVLAGTVLDESAISKSGEAAMVEAEVHGDARGSAAYKRELIRVFMGRAIRQASGRIV